MHVRVFDTFGTDVASLKTGPSFSNALDTKIILHPLILEINLGNLTY